MNDVGLRSEIADKRCESKQINGSCEPEKSWGKDPGKWQTASQLFFTWFFFSLLIILRLRLAYGDLKGAFGWGWGMDQFPGISGQSEPRDLPSANFDKPDKEVLKYLWPLPQNSCESGETWRITYLYH